MIYSLLAHTLKCKIQSTFAFTTLFRKQKFHNSNKNSSLLAFTNFQTPMIINKAEDDDENDDGDDEIRVKKRKARKEDKIVKMETTKPSEEKKKRKRKRKHV